MNTKLTLTIEQEVIERAKHYAKGKKRSLSDLIENYLKTLTKEDKSDTKKLSPVTQSLKGSFKMPKNMDYKKELNLLRKSAKHQIIIEKIKQLLGIIDIIEMDREVVINVLNSEFKDFEGALQNFSAVKNKKIGIIITRNLKDFSKSKLAVLTPETYLKGKIND